MREARPGKGQLGPKHRLVTRASAPCGSRFSSVSKLINVQLSTCDSHTASSPMGTGEHISRNPARTREEEERDGEREGKGEGEGEGERERQRDRQTERERFLYS